MSYAKKTGALTPVLLTDEGAVPVAGKGYTAQTTFARPADTTAYGAVDVVGGVIEFANIGPANGTITINDADLRVDVSAKPTGMDSYRLHLYNAAPPSALADNAPWDLPAGDRASYLGWVDLGTPVDVGSTLFVQTTGNGSKLITMGASTSLWGYLVTSGGYPSASETVHAVRLCAKGV